MNERRLLFLIRHGRSDLSSNAFRETLRGRAYDPPLGDAGREQAELLADRLLTMERPASVYSSPFRRAVETIRPYAERARIEVALEEDLGEAYIGEWEHKSFEEIIESDHEMLRRFRNQDAIWRHAPGAESIGSLRSRVQSAIESILGRHPDGNILIVAHGGVINAYLGPMLGLKQEMFFLPDNASLNSVVVEGGRRRVWFLNDVRHLSDPQLFRRD